MGAIASDAKEWRATSSAEDRAPSVRELFDAHFDFIWRSVRRLGLTSAESDDATQQVFIIASRKLEAIQPGRERAFLFGIGTRVAADMRKGAARRLEHALDDHELAAAAKSSETFVDEARARHCLEVALLAMPLELRTVFLLFELEELTMAEIADVLAIPAGTVASRIRRARETFGVAMRKLQARFGDGT